MVDNIRNFAYSTVATPPSPGTTGTTLILQTGDGAKFPSGAFSATVWPPGVIPLSINAEIVRATVAGDTVTMVRAQEGTSQQNIVAGWQVAQIISANLIAELLLAFDLIGSATAAQAAAQAYADSTKLARNLNLGDLTNTGQARTNLGLGSAAVTSSSAYDAAGVSATETARAMAAEALLATLANPTFTGIPRGPTATAGTNTTQFATTAFVTTAVASAGVTAGVTSFNSRSGVITLLKADVTSTGLSATDVGAAPIANPTFTGIPAGPTPPTGNNSTQFATTAFVQASITALTAGVSTFNTRSGAVTLQKGDITATGLTNTDVNADAAGAATTAAQKMWPVGSVYLSVTNTNPNASLGFGTWSQIAQGLFLVGVGNGSDANGVAFTANEGSKSGTIAGEYVHLLTAAQSGLPDHQQYSDVGGPGSGQLSTNNSGSGYTGSADGVGANWFNVNTGTVVGGPQNASQSHNNTPPYFGVYVWQRTA